MSRDIAGGIVLATREAPPRPEGDDGNEGSGGRSGGDGLYFSAPAGGGSGLAAS